ncbi:MAG TPA: serine/threonine-protein kinase [Dokdonella sp.]|uniref:serine/threonine-protein kinase n=1 Tax=Dokdonella sp. TaxID=2291710 RepID=UPI002B972B3A|nr:serine/threonine-protein kinase [Dokdonella sp.]HUD41274.1 serine/threonine-protein kinase [Dokdonella sp.]
MSGEERWQRLQALFDALIEIDPAEREGWLAAHEADPALRREALALAAADAGADESITDRLRDAAGELGEQPVSGTRLGPYRLLREIGSGGMGTVFLAERVDAEFDRQVAIKLIRGIATSDARQRLRRERQILADLNHPHIARLLDGGTSEAGQPYLVIEYIEGASITRYCQSANLPRRQRLRLFQQVCRAVHYAHQRLVIHRDLKPANVLVREDGTPVLLDFGIAKLLDAQHSGQQTQTGVPWFTPAYASPEQRAGRPVSTATDVYGLGALLYELLLDAAPSPQADGSLPAPSVGAGQARIDRDLDIIVGKATHPEPDRRYGSAEALANDLERYLRGQPIQAAPDSLRYRLGKFARRHRWAVGATAIALVLASVFTWRLAVERDRALRAEAQARSESATAEQVIEYLVSLFEEAAPEHGGAGPVTPRELVDRGRTELDKRLADRPQQRIRLLGALGDIYERLGLTDQAIGTLEAAVALQRETAQEDRRMALLLHELARSYGLAQRFDLAAERVEEAGRLLETIGTEPVLMAELLGSRAFFLTQLGRNEEAVTAGRSALALAELASGADSEDAAVAASMLSDALTGGGRLDEARAAAERSVAILRRLKKPDDDVLISALGHLSKIVYEQGDIAANEALLREMLAARTDRYPPESARITTVRNELGRSLYRQGRLREASAEFQAIVAAMRGQKEAAGYLIALNNLASLLETMGDYAAAEPMFREVFELAGNDGTIVGPRLLVFRQNLGRCLLLAGRLDEAWPLLAPAIVGDDQDSVLRSERMRQQFHLGEWMRRRGRYAEALDYFAQADKAVALLPPEQQYRAAVVTRSRALTLQALGRRAEAEAGLRRAESMLRAEFGDDSPQVIEVRVDLAGLLVELERPDEAGPLLDAVAPSLNERFVDRAPARVRYHALRRTLQQEAAPVAAASG